MYCSYFCFLSCPILRDQQFEVFIIQHDYFRAIVKPFNLHSHDLPGNGFVVGVNLCDPKAILSMGPGAKRCECQRKPKERREFHYLNTGSTRIGSNVDILRLFWCFSNDSIVYLLLEPMPLQMN